MRFAKNHEGVPSSRKPPPRREGEIAALLCMALDGAAADPVRLKLMTALIMLRHDEDRDADLDRLRAAVTIPSVTRL